MARASALISLRYLELAAAGSYKALFAAVLSRTPGTGESAWCEHGMSIWLHGLDLAGAEATKII